MYYANGNEDYRRMSPKQHLLARDERQHHPVEVVVKGEEDNDDSKTAEDRCSFRSWYIGILAFVITGTAAFGLIYYFLMIPQNESTEKPEGLNFSPVETSSEANVIFNDWYASLKRGSIEEFDFNSAIDKELTKYYDDILEQNHPKYLRKFFNHHHRHLQDIYTETDFLEFLSRFNSNKLNFFIKTLKEMKNPPISLMRFKNFFNRTGELHLWYNYLHDLRNFLSGYGAQKNRSDFSKTITKMDFSAFTNETQRKISNSEIKFNSDEKKLKELNDLVSEFTEQVEILVKDSSVTFQNKIIILSEIAEKLQNLYGFTDVNIFATGILYLDVDLNLPGVNLALISPQWEFLRNVTIDLDGLDGLEHENGTASPGEDGRPGNPGVNGGDFIGIGNLNEKELTVFSKGGNGSDGQNGADGRNGINGGNPDSFIGTPTCVVKDSITVNKMGEVVVYYKVFDNNGCGESGTNGGVAGRGGKGGEAFFINTNLKTAVRSSSKDGIGGKPGKGGKGGVGGMNGCYYKAYCINDRSWNRVTTSKCSDITMPYGKSGKDNANVKGLLEPMQKPGISAFAGALSQYRQFAREHVTKYHDLEVYSFIKSMDETPAVCNLTEPEALLNEMQAIEKSKNVEFYESLVRRIDLVLKCSNNEDHKKMLKQFRLLVKGKISNLKYTYGNYLVIDLEKYLGSITSSLHDFTNTTLPKKEEKPLLRESFEVKLKELEEILKEEVEKLEEVYLFHNETVEDLLKNKYLLERENIDHNKYYIAVAGHMDAKRITYLIMITCKSLQPLTQISLNHLLNKKAPLESYKQVKEMVTEFEKLKQENLKSALKVSKIIPKGNGEDEIDVEHTPQQNNILLLSQILIDFKEYDGQKVMEKSVRFSKIACKKFREIEKDLLKHLRFLSDEKLDISGTRNHVQKLRKVLIQINREYRINDNGKYVINGVISQLEHYLTVLAFVESYSQEDHFIKSLNNTEKLGITDPVLYQKTMEFKARLYNVLIASQYKHALNAFRQWVFPHDHMFDDLIKPTEEMPVTEAVVNIERMKRKVMEYKSTIASVDKNIREAVFHTNSSIGEFFTWDNREIANDLEDLFSGKKITLRADVENIHVLNKNAIKFKTIGLDFKMRNGQERDITEFLKNFAVEMKHSGYSYYYYKGETYIITSDDVTIYYSWKLKPNGVPEVHNRVYKKLQDGDIMLSPYTTWTVQLQQINTEANYDKLIEYARKVDVALVGSGTYIAETNDDKTNSRLDESYRPIRRDQLL